MSLEKAETKNLVNAWTGVSLKALYREAPDRQKKNTSFDEKGTSFQIPTLEHRIAFLNSGNEVRNNIMAEHQSLLEKK